MNAGGKPLFIPADANSPLNAGISVDLKQCSFIKDGEEVVSALPAENELYGRLIISKRVAEVTAENGKTKKIKQNAYGLEISGKLFDCPDAVGKKILACGKKISGGQLSVRFAPNQVESAADGIPAQVTRILDYGTERFAECIVRQALPVQRKPKRKGEEAPSEAFAEFGVYVAVDNGFNADAINLAPQTDIIRIYGNEQGIRII